MRLIGVSALMHIPVCRFAAPCGEPDDCRNGEDDHGVCGGNDLLRPGLNPEDRGGEQRRDREHGGAQQQRRKAALFSRRGLPCQKQQRSVHRLTDLSALDDQCRLHTLAYTDEIVVYC